MFRRLQMMVLLATGASLVACGDSRDTAPTSPQFQIGTGPACSPTNVKKYAKALAGTSSLLYNLAQQFTPSNANSVFATNLFFNFAAELANIARPGTLSTTQKTDLANALIQGIACANVVVSDENYSASGYVDEFSLAAGATGVLEVRGRTASENANIYAHNVGAHGSAGLKAPTEGFAAWFGKRVVYGFPRAGFSAEAPPISNRIAFELFTVYPAGGTFDETLRGQIAICVLYNLGQLDPTQLRIQHSETITPVGDFNELPCAGTPPPTFGSRPDDPESLFGGTLAWLGRNLLPEPLHATSLLLTTKPTGKTTTLSPSEAVNPLGATLTFVPPPSDGPVDEGLGITVHATGAALTDWEGLLIRIRAQDNNGRFVTVSPDTATTNSLGVADFTTSTINKPGVYKLVGVTLPSSDGDASGFVQDSVISGNFHRSPN
jgi:hypothetical protein